MTLIDANVVELELARKFRIRTLVWIVKSDDTRKFSDYC